MIDVNKNKADQKAGRPATDSPGPGSDIASLRLSQDFSTSGGVRKILMTIPVRKPNGQEWVFVHPDAEMHFTAAVIMLKEEGEIYIVDGALRDQLIGEWVPMALYPTITRQGVVILWPIRLPGEDGRLDRWSQSATEAAGLAMKGWIRMKSSRSLGAYEVSQPLMDFPPPVWPDKGIDELVVIAFKGKVIDREDHPVLQRLRGEI